MSNAKIIGLTAAALAAFFTAVFFGISQIEDSSATYDEPVHLASGYLALKTQLPPLNWRDHPPLAEMWGALPLLFLNPSTMTLNPDFGRLYNFSDQFIYKNRVDASRLLNSARIWNLISLLLILFPAVLAWSWSLGREPSFLAASFFLAFCPPIFSNFALATTDAMPTVFYLLTCFFLSRPNRGLTDWALSGLCLGGALASKFSMIMLPIVIVSALLTEARVSPKRWPKISQVLIFVFLTALTLAFAYRLSGFSLYWDGLLQTLTRLSQGRPSFLWGRYSQNGFWDFFPVALAVKTPIPLLIFAALGIYLALRKPSDQEIWLLMPPVAYFIAALISKTDIGYRHILPIYPFLIVLGSRAVAALKIRLSRRMFAASLIVGALWTALSVIRAYPHYLVYFNELTGGPSGGYHLLADSSLDWGQGLKDLGRELKKRGNPPIILSYFGVADPSYEGIRYFPLAFYSNVDRRDGTVLPKNSGPLLLAISETNLQAVYFADKNIFSWLKKRKPAFTAGNSIFVYDLTHDVEGRKTLSNLLAASGSIQAAKTVLSGEPPRSRKFFPRARNE